MCLHINWKALAACDLNFIVKHEGLLKVTGSHVHWKSGNISETVLDTVEMCNYWPLTRSDNSYPSIHPCNHSPDRPSRPATTSSIFLFHSILFTVRWTAAGSVHPHQSMMSSTHRLGGRPPSTMPSNLSSSILHMCTRIRPIE